jgi:hypothetical protein
MAVALDWAARLSDRAMARLDPLRYAANAAISSRKPEY